MREETWVEGLRQRFPFALGLGIGDDAAVFKPSAGRSLVLTADLLVEGVHFRRETVTPEQLALKSLAVNLSDLAAMGARPLCYTIALALPRDYMGKDLERFYDGIEEGNKRWNVALAGGDLSASRLLTVSITALGETDNPVLRSGAQTGDLVGVCGRLGWSKLGWLDLEAGIRTGPFVEAHLEVEPLLEPGWHLRAVAHAMMDVSDGLLKDLKRLCQASGVGARIEGEALSLEEPFLARCAHYGLSPLETALTGGEDYALLFTAPANAFAEMDSWLPSVSFRVIGSIVPVQEGVTVSHKGCRVELAMDGFDHFALL